LAPEWSWDGELRDLVQILELDLPAEAPLAGESAPEFPLQDEKLPSPNAQRPKARIRALQRRCKKFFRDCCSVVRQTCIESRISVARATDDLVLRCRTIGKGKKALVYGLSTNF
jgi:hypothetical protein